MKSLAIAAALTLTAGAAWPACLLPPGPHDKVLAAFAESGERPVLGGFIGESQFMEFLVSAKGGWTIMVTDTRDITCVLASGTGLMQIGDVPIDAKPL